MSFSLCYHFMPWFCKLLKIHYVMPHQDTLSYIPKSTKTQELPGSSPHRPQPGTSGSPLHAPARGPGLCAQLCIQVVPHFSFERLAGVLITLNIPADSEHTTFYQATLSDLLIQQLFCYTSIFGWRGKSSPLHFLCYQKSRKCALFVIFWSIGRGGHRCTYG